MWVDANLRCRLHLFKPMKYQLSDTKNLNPRNPIPSSLESDDKRKDASEIGLSILKATSKNLFSPQSLSDKDSTILFCSLSTPDQDNF